MFNKSRMGFIRKGKCFIREGKCLVKQESVLDQKYFCNRQKVLLEEKDSGI